MGRGDFGLCYTLLFRRVDLEIDTPHYNVIRRPSLPSKQSITTKANYEITSAGSESKNLLCVSVGLTLSDVRRNTTKYDYSHPQHEHLRAANLVIRCPVLAKAGIPAR